MPGDSAASAGSVSSCALAGGGHSQGLVGNGMVYSWRENASRQLGLAVGNVTDQGSPTMTCNVELASRVIATGLSHTIILDADGTAWTMGADISWS